MTAERLAAIRDLLAAIHAALHEGPVRNLHRALELKQQAEPWDMAEELLAEVDRLRAGLATQVWVEANLGRGPRICDFCGTEIDQPSVPTLADGGPSVPGCLCELLR